MLALPPAGLFDSDLPSPSGALNTLSGWFIKQVDGKLHVCGHMDQSPHELKVKARVDTRVVVVEDGRSVLLEGAMDAAQAAIEGCTVDVLGKFRAGFPPDWSTAWPALPPPPPPPPRHSARLGPAAPPPGVRRSDRIKLLPEEACYNEDELLLREVAQLDRRSGDRLLLSDDSSSEEGAEAEGEAWSASEKARLRGATMELDPARLDYWECVAQALPGRSAQGERLAGGAATCNGRTCACPNTRTHDHSQSATRRGRRQRRCRAGRPRSRGPGRARSRPRRGPGRRGSGARCARRGSA
jgi:hypothetical protein